MEQKPFVRFLNLFALDRLYPNLDFDISFLEIGRKVTELRELEDKHAANHEPGGIF